MLHDARMSAQFCCDVVPINDLGIVVALEGKNYAMKIASLILLTTLIVPLLSTTAASSQTSLLDSYAACEASVMRGSDDPLRTIGSLIDEEKRGSRIQIDTPEGSLMAMFIPPSRGITACIFWGQDPELAKEFEGRWTDWVEWEEASSASKKWFKNAMKITGSVDLTDHAKPGYVIARCDSLEHGVVLSSQPAVANALRQVLPKPTTKIDPMLFYQFSVVTALPGRCAPAVNAQN